MAQIKIYGLTVDKKVYSHCPAALDLDKVIQDLQKISALTKVNVRVLTAEREYVKRVTLEEGVRGLMGLIMATSAMIYVKRYANVCRPAFFSF